MVTGAPGSTTTVYVSRVVQLPFRLFHVWYVSVTVPGETPVTVTVRALAFESLTASSSPELTIHCLYRSLELVPVIMMLSPTRTVFSPVARTLTPSRL